MNDWDKFAVDAQDLWFSYPVDPMSPKAELVLERFTLRVGIHSAVVISGPSGVGKSTLAALLARRLLPQRGLIRYHPSIQKPRDIAYVHQQPMNAVFPWQTVHQNIEYPLRKHGWNALEQRRRVAWALELFNLREVEFAFPAHLSGGELQRLALARNLVWKPKLAVLDEPLSAVDAARRRTLLKSLRDFAREDGTTFVTITHNMIDANTLGDRCVILRGRPARITADFRIRGRDGISPKIQETSDAFVDQGR